MKGAKEILEKQQNRVIEDAKSNLAFFNEQNEILQSSLKGITELGQIQTKIMQEQTRATSNISTNFKEVIGKEDQQGTFNNLLKNMNLALPFVDAALNGITSIMDFGIMMGPLAIPIQMAASSLKKETIEDVMAIVKDSMDWLASDEGKGVLSDAVLNMKSLVGVIQELSATAKEVAPELHGLSLLSTATTEGLRGMLYAIRRLYEDITDKENWESGWEAFISQFNMKNRHGRA